MQMSSVFNQQNVCIACTQTTKYDDAIPDIFEYKNKEKKNLILKTCFSKCFLIFFVGISFWINIIYNYNF